MIKNADSINIGDYLPGSDGKPVKVLAKSKPEFRQFYRIKFDDGTEFECSDNHIWTVFDLATRGPGQKQRGWHRRDVETEWLFGQNLKFRDQRRFAIPLISNPVEPTNPIEPILPPYLLGYWFGNGCKQGSALSCHANDAAEIKFFAEQDLGISLEIRNYEPGTNNSMILLKGWIQKLKACNWPFITTENGERKICVFDKSRMHHEWRNWSSKNRMLLLAGLIDSDGNVGEKGCVEFSNTKPELTQLVRDILMSLGEKVCLPICREPRGKGKQKIYHVKCYSKKILFRLSRKVEIQKSRIIPRQLKQYRRYITSIEKTKFEWGVCFGVDSQDHLYVAGLDYVLTHNSHFIFAQVCLDDCQRYPGLNFLYVRKSAKTLRSQIGKMLRSIMPSGLNYNYREQAGEIRFNNGSFITIRHFKDESEIDNFLGEEYDGIAYEELTTLSQDKFTNLNTCLRTSKRGWRPRIYASWNWGNIGHHWVKKFFYDPWLSKRQTTTRYILALVQDNRHIDPEYQTQLENLVGWKYQSWYLGNPDLAAGNFFANYREDVHVWPCECLHCKSEQTYVLKKGVVKCGKCLEESFAVTFEDDDAVRWFGSMDYGSSMPNCFHLHAENIEGDCFTVAEVHTIGFSISENSELFRDACRLHNIEISDLEFIASGEDVAKGDRKTAEDGSTILTEYRENGIDLTPIHINRVDAWSQMQERIGDPCRGIKPRWYIHRSCVNLRTQVQTAQYDPKRPNDIVKQNADKETGEGGSDALESARNALTHAYNSVLKSAVPVKMGDFQSPSESRPENDILDIEAVISEAQRIDREENSM